MTRGVKLFYLTVFVGLVIFAASQEKPATTTAAAPTKPTSYVDELREIAGERAQGITAKQYEAAAGMIRLYGYDCPHADLMIRYAFSEGYTVYCREGRYRFELEIHGGKWSIKAP
jgi:hypothetical protein